MNIFDKVVLLLTGLVALYMLYRFIGRYGKEKKTYDLYYMLGFLVLLVAGLLLIFMGYGILASPYVLVVASLIPLGISVGVASEYYSWGRAYCYFAWIGFLAIAVTSFGGMELLKKISVPIFHGVAGFVIFLGPFFAPKAPKGFWWVGIGGALIGLGGMALAFLSAGKQLLFFSASVVNTILAPLLLLMALAMAWGFMKDLEGSKG